MLQAPRCNIFLLHSMSKVLLSYLNLSQNNWGTWIGFSNVLAGTKCCHVSSSSTGHSQKVLVLALLPFALPSYIVAYQKPLIMAIFYFMRLETRL